MNSMMLIVGPILRPESWSARSLTRTFDARASGRADDCGMNGAGRQDHADPRLQLQALFPLLEHEGDRPLDAVEHLIEAVRVRGVAVARPVRPRVAAAGLGLQFCSQLVERITR